MDGGHTTHYDVFKAAETNNRNKKEENFEKEKRDRKVMGLHETDTLKALEHVTENGISTNQYKNNQLEIILLWHGIQKSKQRRLTEKKKKWKYIKENNRQPPAYNRWIQEDEKKILHLRSRDIQIDNTALRRHKKTQV